VPDDGQESIKVVWSEGDIKGGRVLRGRRKRRILRFNERKKKIRERREGGLCQKRKKT
jgi:hypothetical protein